MEIMVMVKLVTLNLKLQLILMVMVKLIFSAAIKPLARMKSGLP
jgi:hypothetical protein